MGATNRPGSLDSALTREESNPGSAYIFPFCICSNPSFNSKPGCITFARYLKNAIAILCLFFFGWPGGGGLNSAKIGVIFNLITIKNGGF